MLCLFIVALLGLATGAETYDGSQYFWGDLHAHTGVSGDGTAIEYGNCRTPIECGSVAEVFNIAKANHLDFVALTDHNHTSPAADFNALLARCRQETNGSFVCIPSSEFSTLNTQNSARYGHKNLYLFQDDDARLTNLSLADFPTPSIATGTCATALWSTAANVYGLYGPTLFWAHHPTAASVATTNWSCNNPMYEPVVEVYSGWGNALTYPASYDPPTGDDVSTVDTPTASSSVHYALNTGLRLGFVAGTDLHDTRPGEVCDRGGARSYAGGLTMLTLPQGTPFSRAAIYAELVGRRSLATTGPRVPVSVAWVTSDGVPHRIGEQIAVITGTTVTLSVRVPSTYAASVTGVSAVGYSSLATLASVGTGTWTATFSSSSLPSWLYVQVAIDGAVYYGTAACDDGGADQREFVWSSPAWFSVVDPEPVDMDEDGVSPPIDCDDNNSSISPGQVEVCDGLDNDCNGSADINAADMLAFYVDGDGDGYGAGSAFYSCFNIAGRVTNATDCNDSRPAIHPGARERRGNGIDENCDGVAD